MSRYSAAGVETAGDFMTGGFLQPSNPVFNTVNRFVELGSDTAVDYGNLAQGGTINPFAENKEATEEDKGEDTEEAAPVPLAAETVPAVPAEKAEVAAPEVSVALSETLVAPTMAETIPAEEAAVVGQASQAAGGETPAEGSFSARSGSPSEHHVAEGDLFMTGSGYLGGPAVNPPEHASAPAPWPLFAAEGAVTGAKYSAAGVETAGDFMTGGFLQPSNPVFNTVNRFVELGSDTAVDYGNLAQGGTINPFANQEDAEEAPRLGANPNKEKEEEASASPAAETVPAVPAEKAEVPVLPAQAMPSTTMPAEKAMAAAPEFPDVATETMPTMPAEKVLAVAPLPVGAEPLPGSGRSVVSARCPDGARCVPVEKDATAVVAPRSVKADAAAAKASVAADEATGVAGAASDRLGAAIDEALQANGEYMNTGVAHVQARIDDAVDGIWHASPSPPPAPPFTTEQLGSDLFADVLNMDGLSGVQHLSSAGHHVAAHPKETYNEAQGVFSSESGSKITDTLSDTASDTLGLEISFKHAPEDSAAPLADDAEPPMALNGPAEEPPMSLHATPAATRIASAGSFSKFREGGLVGALTVVGVGAAVAGAAWKRWRPSYVAVAPQMMV